MPRSLPLGALIALLSAVTVVWACLDQRPPAWDHANHLERAFKCYRILSEPGHDRFREIVDATAFYPPLVPCATGLLYFAFPAVPLTAQAVMLAYLGIAIVAVFALGRRLWGPDAGLLAAFFLGTAPFVVFSLTNYQLDLPLMAMVAVALYAMARTEHFSNSRWSVALGVVFGLGMLTKPPFAAYVLPPLLWVTWLARHAPDRSRRLARLALVLVIGGAVAVSWYGPRLLGLPMQISARSFKQAAESGYPDVLSVEGLLFYPRVLQPQFGILAGLLFVWGAIALCRDRATRAFLWLATIVPFVMFSLIQNKNLRYTLPMMPATALVTVAGVHALTPRWRRGITWACVGVGLLQVSMAAFTIPTPVRVPGLLLPLVVGQPPSREDWQHEQILADLSRETGGAPTRVAVVPNYNFFSISTLRYEAIRRRLPLDMSRPWSDMPFGIDFVILKTGSQGPSFSVARAERIMKAFDGGDPYLAEVFPLIHEYPLPDGSTGMVRARRVPPLAGVPAATVAHRLETSPERLFRDHVGDPVNLRVRVNYRPEALLRGVVDQVQIEVDSAVVGELARKDRAPLRVREIRLRADGLLFNPHRLMSRDQLEVLDVEKLRVERLVVIEEDLNEFLRGQRLAGIHVGLEEGAGRVRATQFGPTISSRIRLVAGTPGRPLALNTEALTVSGVPVPGFVVGWIVRQFDPGPALGRLPVKVLLGPIRIHPGRIQIGE
jgi:hypothetical protein